MRAAGRCSYSRRRLGALAEIDGRRSGRGTRRGAVEGIDKEMDEKRKCRRSGVK